MGEFADRFRKRVIEELLPTFCDDPARGFDSSVLVPSAIAISELDAHNFLRAIDSRLVVDTGGGRYRSARSQANEQLFWEGSRKVVPRPLTLWLEPVITIATVARLHFDLAWPLHCLGMQSKDYAFDFVAYEGDRVVIAGEVKKSSREIDTLVEHMVEFGRAGAQEAPPKGDKRLNAFQKWRALRGSAIPIFWAVGPNDYTKAFRVNYHADGSFQLQAMTVGELARSESIADA